MKPLKSGIVLANWIMRIALAILLLVMCAGVVKNAAFSSKDFYIAAGFIVLGCLIFIGGFMSKPATTVVSGFLLSGLAIYEIIILFAGALNPLMASYLLILSIGFYFACTGNQ